MEDFKFIAKFKTDFSKGTYEGEVVSQNKESAEQFLAEKLPEDLHIEPSDIISITVFSK